MAIQPARLILLTIVVLAFRSLGAFALAVLAIYAAAVIAVFRAGPPPGVARLEIVDVVPAQEPRCHRSSLGARRTVRSRSTSRLVQRSATCRFLGCGCLYFLSWLIALHAAGHPLAEDPIFLRARVALRLGKA
jgi:hypothetical protein